MVKQNGDFHDSEKKLKAIKKSLSELKQNDKALGFIEHLQAKDLAPLTLVKYGSYLIRVLRNFDDVESVGRKEVEAYVAKINDSGYKPWTKHTYKLVVKKFFQYLRSGDTSKETPYPPEVSWIKVHVSETELEKSSRTSPENLLNIVEVEELLKAAQTPRDEAMISVLFEGAFRPSEMLAMSIRSVQFLQDYCVISTKGKTGQKRIPLVASYSPLLKWVSQHPFRMSSEAPLWCAVDTGHRGHGLSYRHFRLTIRKIAKRAGIRKDVWPYLFRHSQLTSMADKLTDSKLTLFAGWRLGTKMVRKYVHWSGRELDQNVLALHGLLTPTTKLGDNGIGNNSGGILTPVECQRCSAKNSPSAARCERCGLILDIELASQAEADITNRLESLEQQVKNLLLLSGRNA